MKVTFGGHKKMTIQNQPYETISVESTLIIEKEAPDNMDLSDIEEYQNKVNAMLDKDLEKKAKETLQAQQRTRNRMKAFLKELG